MGAGPGGATTEQFIVAAQKATNQLKALLANAKPLLASEGDASAGAQRSGSAVDALLSEITDSLSQALASLQLGPLDTQPPPAQPGQSSTCGGGGRRSTPRRSCQRVRMDGACRMIVLQNESQDSYKWRKYGQKEILGARFPRSYFKCGRNSSCPARKQVQQTDADPSKLELTYLEAHTCDDDPPPQSSHFVPDTMVSSSSTQWSAAQRVPTGVAAVSSAQQHHIGQPSSLPMPMPMITAGLMMMAGSNVRRTTCDHLVPSPSAPVAAAVPAALPSNTTAKCDHVPDDHMAFTPWTEEEQAEVLLFIPSPACSQSELLPTEVAKVELHGPPVWMDHDLACDGNDQNTVSDFAVVPKLQN
ncbi:hypothetical protein U9M48_012718 [Paspalum notatum var. saurae]|uniref:WRKY domain-containing protein n=1 Tax=Paspalum notatum var. saurae TaxID=547442 RepID=A0AAQ3T089_PASNO